MYSDHAAGGEDEPFQSNILLVLDDNDDFIHISLSVNLSAYTALGHSSSANQGKLLGHSFDGR